jgi:hypothetical protein
MTNGKGGVGNLVVSLFNKALPLFAVGFPGGYKFLVIMVITIFAGANVADEFSKAYFWVGLLVSFSGLPMALLMVSTEHNIRPNHGFSLVLISALISFTVAYAAVLNSYSLMMVIAIFMSSLFLSYYETTKRHLLNDGAFLPIFKTSIVSLLIFFTLFFLTKSNVEWLFLSVFFSLLLPLAIRSLYERNTVIGPPSSLLLLIRDFLRYLLSNITSTSLGAAVPLVIIAEMGDTYSSQMAQVFSFSSLMYLLPRVLSAKHIPNMRQNGVNYLSIQSFFRSILIFVLIAISFSMLIFYFIYDQWLIFWLLFSTMQASQLTLPYSNILMVMGAPAKILQVNLITTFVLVGACVPLFLMLSPGPVRAEWFLTCYFLSMFLRLSLSYRICKKHISYQ